MEYFFTNNLYIIFALIIYSLFISEKPKEINKKIIVVYSFISLLAFFNILDIKIMLYIFIFISFLYFEVLMEDYYKFKIIKKIRYKLIDYAYILIVKYLFILFVLALYFLSEASSSLNFIPLNIKYFLFAIIFIYITFHICNNDFELNNFNDIMKKLTSKVDFANYKKLSKRKTDMLIYVEDKSFFERPNNYTLVCWDYIKYRISKISEVIDKYKTGKGKIHAINHVIHFIIYSIKQIIKQLKDIPKFLKRVLRGHSTIEMQLFRSVAVKSGYNKVIQRKISELIYTPIFFSGLKDYYKLNYKIITDNYYKEYIIACYLYFAKVFYRKRVYKNIYYFYSSNDFSDAEFLIYILCLSGKAKENLIIQYSQLFNIDKSEIAKAIKKISNEN